MYIREARRFKGEYLYREQDCLQLDGLNRAPIHRDGIAFTEFALDSLPCSPKRFEGSLPDGQFFEKDKTMPGTLPWRCLIPNGIANLLTPTSPSVTHCAWGTVRQTASLLHLAEVCSHAAFLSLEKHLEPVQLPTFELQMHLVKHGTMIAFFNDLDMASPEPWKEAALLFGNHGFFADYNARPEEALDKRTAELWGKGIKSILSGKTNPPHDLAFRINEVDQSTNFVPVDKEAFCSMLGIDKRDNVEEIEISRKEALEIMYGLLW